MKYKDGLELQLLRREQDHIHRLVRGMDERLDQLAASVLAPGSLRLRASRFRGSASDTGSTTTA